MVKRAPQKGFTVVEVMMGIALFGLVMPSVILGVVGISRLNDRAADLTRANIVAENKIESLRSRGYNSLTDGSTDFETELEPSFTKPRTAAYTVTTTTPGLKQINVQIQYTDNGTLRTLVYRSIIGELGVAQ